MKQLVNVSSMPWLPAIDSSWDVVRAGHFLSVKKTVVGEKWPDYTLLSLTKAGVIIRDFTDRQGKLPETFDSYQEVQIGDLVMCLFDMDETPRTVGISSHRGMITGAYTTFQFDQTIAVPRYFEYLFISIDDRKAFKAAYSGLRKTIRPPVFLSLRFPLPPLETQQRIADYLDRETAEIDAAVADLDRYVELLEKRRQVMIAQSVTRGIGSNRTRVHLRALPGSEGVMNSPTKKVPFWSLLEFINAPVESSSYGVRLEDIDSWTGRLFDNEIRDRGDSQGTPFQPGDSLFGKLRPYLAKSWLATTSGVAVGDIHVYRPKRHCEPRFLSYILRTSDFIRFAEGVSEGVKMPRSEWSKLRQYPIPLPPLETQQRIADYLDRETAEIDSLIAESTTLRDLLLKRCSALITEVVTGRKQV